MKRPEAIHPIDAVVMRRLDALERLIDAEYDSKPSVFESKTGIKMAQVGQWFTGYRALRDKALRRLEERTGKPDGWFDRTLTTQTVVGIEGHGRQKTRTDELVIRQFDTGGSMGGGLLLKDQPGSITSWTVTDEWAQKNVHRITSFNNLTIVTGFGDSMKPTYNPGDPLLVDTGVKDIDHEGIFFFRVGNEGFIKRLQRIPRKGIVVISDNAKYRDWTIEPGDDFEVFGKVVKAWCGDDF